MKGKKLFIDTTVLPRKRSEYGITTNNKDKIYIFGGIEGFDYFNDLWELSCMFLITNIFDIMYIYN